MITAHQPTIFGNNVIAAISSKKNGNMRFGFSDDSDVIKNRKAFLDEVGINIENTTLVPITYDTNDFIKYRVIHEDEKGAGMLSNEVVTYADALIVDAPEHALFLPLADCVGAILYDSKRHILMVSHLGRHSVEMYGAAKSVAYLKHHFSSDPRNIKVWLSPGVGKASYPLHAFEGRSLHEVITSQLIDEGIEYHHIENANIDTATSHEYYSHSEYLKGKESLPGRFAIVAQMRTQGEPAS